MKTRNGFVSNSSSSSFIIISDVLEEHKWNFYNITDEELEKDKYFLLSREEMGEGSDWFELTKEIREFLTSEKYSQFDFTVHKNPQRFNGDVERDKCPEKFEVTTASISYHASDGLFDIKHRYHRGWDN